MVQHCGKKVSLEDSFGLGLWGRPKIRKSSTYSRPLHPRLAQG